MLNHLSNTLHNGGARLYGCALATGRHRLREHTERAADCVECLLAEACVLIDLERVLVLYVRIDRMLEPPILRSCAASRFVPQHRERARGHTERFEPFVAQSCEALQPGVRRVDQTVERALARLQRGFYLRERGDVVVREVREVGQLELISQFR